MVLSSINRFRMLYHVHQRYHARYYFFATSNFVPNRAKQRKSTTTSCLFWSIMYLIFWEELKDRTIIFSRRSIQIKKVLCGLVPDSSRTHRACADCLELY